MIAFVQTSMKDFVTGICENDAKENQKFQVVKKRKASASPEQDNTKTKSSTIKNLKRNPLKTENRYASLLNLQNQDENDQDLNATKPFQATVSQHNAPK